MSSDVLILEKIITQENVNFGKRVNLVLREQGKSKAWLANKLGISKQAINYLLNHATTPKYVTEIAALLQVNSEWLVLGKNSQQFIPEKDSGIFQIPVIPFEKVSCFKLETSFVAFTQVTQSTSSPNCFATILKDSSMAPTFSEGTLLIFNPENSPKNGDYVICLFKREIFFRQYFDDEKLLKPHDPTHQSFEKESAEIVGVLIESRKYFT